MDRRLHMDLSVQLVEKARDLGASVAGIASASELSSSRSYASQREPCHLEGDSVLVIGLAHSKREPELDWWEGNKRGTPGDRRLKSIGQAVANWVETEFHFRAKPLPYHVERGGIFLKDAALLAGLGTIGTNNLLITPEFGPCIRFRAVSVDAAFTPTGPNDFSPCRTCEGYCARICPQDAFFQGVFSRIRCVTQMALDEANLLPPDKSDQAAHAGGRVAYCRACEMACPARRAGED